jgi:hypothetical protein
MDESAIVADQRAEFGQYSPKKRLAGCGNSKAEQVTLEMFGTSSHHAWRRPSTARIVQLRVA